MIEEEWENKPSKCDSCGGNLVKDVMREEGVEYPILKCTACHWWG